MESNRPSPVCWEEDMIADVSMRMPADIRHNIAQFCQGGIVSELRKIILSYRMEGREFVCMQCMHCGRDDGIAICDSPTCDGGGV